MACLREIAPSIWRVCIGRPRVAILGGVHGNELTGIEVVKRLVDRYTSSGDIPFQGELTLAIGNPHAVQRNIRFVDRDLNRCFSDTPGDAMDLESSRAAVLAPHLRGLDVLLDLHATNKPSAPFARLPGGLLGRSERFSAAERLFLSALPATCCTVLWDPQELIGGGSMTDEYALRHSPAVEDEFSQGQSARSAYICYESGLASDPSSVGAVTMSVDSLLAHLGLREDETPNIVRGRSRDWEHFEITDVFRLDDDGFEWKNGHGSVNFGPVPPGEVFGLKGKLELAAPEGVESYIVFPKVRSLWAVGSPLGWIAKRVSVSTPEE